jgi:hypothetical protein
LRTPSGGPPIWTGTMLMGGPENAIETGDLPTEPVNADGKIVPVVFVRIESALDRLHRSNNLAVETTSQAGDQRGKLRGKPYGRDITHGALRACN